MIQNVDSKCKLCRRAGEKLFLKGDRCFTQKCAMTRKAYAPGMHGNNGRRALSEYARQLAMKQKIKRIYGVMERQFRKYFEDSAKKQGITGDLLLTRLELRLDNVIYRMGFAESRSLARQMVGHGYFTVNGKKVNIPSYAVKVSDVIAISERKKEKKTVQKLKEVLKEKKDQPSWMQVQSASLQGTIVSNPKREDITVQVDPQMVVEFYSK